MSTSLRVYSPTGVTAGRSGGISSPVKWPHAVTVIAAAKMVAIRFMLSPRFVQLPKDHGEPSAYFAGVLV